MSLIGKGTGSYRKKDVMEQKSIALGFNKIKFAHKATLGDSIIDLTALVTPTEMSTNGFVNPTANALAAVNINKFRNNLKLVSSIRGLLIDQLSYSINSATKITLLGFTAEDGEIFVGHMDEAATTSLTAVDGRSIVASGTLLAGQTDFNIGTPIEINKYAGQDVGAVVVFADRGLQSRKVGNVVGGTGDYYEVPVAGGLGSILRFNASASDRYIQVISNGIVAERPDGSMTAMIERAQGQIDAMVPTLAAVAGVPTTTFQTAPSSVDLKQFGDTVVTNTTNITTHTTQIAALQPYVGENLSALRQYNLTITGNNSWSTTRATGVPYLTLDGTWRMRFNIRGTSTGTTSESLTFSGVTFKSGYIAGQAVSVAGNNAGYGWFGLVGDGSSGLLLGSNNNCSDWQVSGDVELNSKPTFVP